MDCEKCVKVSATRQAIANIMAGRFKPFEVVNSLDEELKNHYVHYNSDRDLFEIVYYTDDCPNGAIPKEVIMKTRILDETGKCKLCGKETNSIYNINFKAVSICQNCALSITKQEVESWSYEEK